MVTIIPKLIGAGVLVALGLSGLLTAFIVPHERHFSDDHAAGFGVMGALWALGCLILAYNVLVA